MALSLLSFGIRSVLLSVTHQGSLCGVRAFAGKAFVCVCLSLCRSHCLGCYLTLSPPDCSQGFQAQALPQGLKVQPVPPCPALTHWWQPGASVPLLRLCLQLWLDAYSVGFSSSQLCCPPRFQSSPQTHL